MRIDIITVVPELLKSPFESSILKNSIDKGIVNVKIHNLREYSNNKYKSVDDYQFGGGAGMVLMIEPIDKCISKLKNERQYDEVIYLSPDGEKLDQSIVNKFSLFNNLIILCGHYKGIDQRIRDYLVTDEISIGDYIISGGELSSMIILDSIVRLIPGVLNSYESAETDTYMSDLLDCPHYTRPREFNGYNIPEVLLSGNHNEIEKWKKNKREEKTKLIRPDIWEKYNK